MDVGFLCKKESQLLLRQRFGDICSFEDLEAVQAVPEPKRPKNWKMARMFVGVLVGMLVAFGRPGSPCFTLVHPVGGNAAFHNTAGSFSATGSFF